MGWFTGIVVFLMVWWTLLFVVLPFGHERDKDGTPVFANIKRKFIITTIVSGLVWIGIHLLVSSDLISFQNMAQNMIEEDRVRS